MASERCAGLTIAGVKRLLPRAEMIAARLGASEEEAPITLGYVGLAEEIDGRDIERGVELATEHGW